MKSRLLWFLVFVLGPLGCGGRTELDTYTQSSGTGGTTAIGNAVSAIAAGWDHTCVAIRGEVQCWGFNGDGEFGNGTTTSSMTPVQVQGLTSGVFIGGAHACVVVNGAAAMLGRQLLR